MQLLKNIRSYPNQSHAQELHISTRELKDMSEYYFDGKGKAFRPIIVVLMARACNIHHNNARREMLKENMTNYPQISIDKMLKHQNVYILALKEIF